MLLIPCPYCGERAESEFSCGGEAHIARPADPEKVSDEDWAKTRLGYRRLQGHARLRLGLRPDHRA